MSAAIERQARNILRQDVLYVRARKAWLSVVLVRWPGEDQPVTVTVRRKDGQEFVVEYEPEAPVKLR